MATLTLREMLNELTDKYGYSQAEVSRLTGINKTRISKLSSGNITTMMWEDGRRMHALHRWIEESKQVSEAKGEVQQ